MKKRFIKRTAVLALVGATQLAMLTGCGGDSKSSKKETTTETTTVSETDGSTSEGNTEVNEEAIDQVFNHIEINGKHVDFPFTLNDLGDEYEYGNFTDMGNGTYGCVLRCNGEKVASTICVAAESEEDITRDSEVVYVALSEEHEQQFTVNGINCDSSIDDAIKKLNTLSLEYDDNGDIDSLKYYDGKYYVKVFIIENKINGIYLDILDLSK